MLGKEECILRVTGTQGVGKVCIGWNGIQGSQSCPMDLHWLCYADIGYGRLCCAVLSHSVTSDSLQPHMVARQAPLSMGILLARILECVAMLFSRGSSRPRSQTGVSCTAGGEGQNEEGDEGSVSGGRRRMDLWLIHVNIWQKPTQYCKTIILHLKKIKLKKENEEVIHLFLELFFHSCVTGFNTLWGFPVGVSGKEPAFQCRRWKRHRFDPWVRKILWRRKRQPTPIFLPGKSHGQRSLVGSLW